VQWFAAAHLRRETDLTSWEEVGKQDIQRWIVWLLDRYSSAYASNQYRALQQFFKWLAAEEEVLDPMAGLKPPGVPDKPVPVFAAGDLPDRAVASGMPATPMHHTRPYAAHRRFARRLSVPSGRQRQGDLTPCHF
jgi:integrase